MRAAGRRRRAGAFGILAEKILAVVGAVTAMDHCQIRLQRWMRCYFRGRIDTLAGQTHSLVGAPFVKPLRWRGRGMEDATTACIAA